MKPVTPFKRKGYDPVLRIGLCVLVVISSANLWTSCAVKGEARLMAERKVKTYVTVNADGNPTDVSTETKAIEKVMKDLGYAKESEEVRDIPDLGLKRVRQNYKKE